MTARGQGLAPMLNHHNGRAYVERKRKPDRAEAIRLACVYLRNIAETTATGATLFPPPTLKSLANYQQHVAHGMAKVVDGAWFPQRRLRVVPR